ncbi:MAG: hypothetical protein ACKOFB_02785 [bacterium]
MSLEFSNLSPSEMLTLYMDGELPEAMQPSLFTMLSEQVDLRQEMQDHFTMRKFIDNTMIMPPEAMHESIMRRVGAIAIGATVNNPVSTGMMQTMTTWLGKAVQPLMYIVIGATLSGLYFASQQDAPQISETAIARQSLMSPQSIKPSTAFVTNNIGQSISSAMKTDQSGFSNAQSSTVNTNETMLSESSNDDIPMIQQEIIQIPQKQEQQSEYAYPIATNDQSLLPKAVEKTPSIDNIEKANSPFSLTMRGFAQHSFVDQTVTPVTDPFINNVSIGLQYDLSDRDAIYVEAGQESVVQRYTGTENNYTVQYNQTYLAPWAIIGWQHRFVGNHALRPLIRVGVGGMETGPMARMTLGMEYDVSKSITLIGGIEGMSTLYSYQGQWFSTQKAGITYGTRISLR